MNFEVLEISEVSEAAEDWDVPLSCCDYAINHSGLESPLIGYDNEVYDHQETFHYPAFNQREPKSVNKRHC